MEFKGSGGVLGSAGKAPMNFTCEGSLQFWAFISCLEDSGDSPLFPLSPLLTLCLLSSTVLSKSLHS